MGNSEEDPEVIAAIEKMYNKGCIGCTRNDCDKCKNNNEYKPNRTLLNKKKKHSIFWWKNKE